MAARGAAAARMAAMEAASGFNRIGLAQGLGALLAAVQPQAPSTLGVVPVRWDRLLRGGVVPAFLTGMVAPETAWRTSAAKAAAATVVRRVANVISLEAVLEMVHRTAGSAVDADAPLMEAGVDSLGAVELRNQLQQAVGDDVALSSTLMFDHPSARQVAVHLNRNQPCVADVVRGDNAAPVLAGEQVEIVGLSTVLPQGVSALREMSHCGRNLLRVIPLARWDVEQAALHLHGRPAEVRSRVWHGGFLHNGSSFRTASLASPRLRRRPWTRSSGSCLSAATRRCTRRQYQRQPSLAPSSP
jgi:hypothetical protein